MTAPETLISSLFQAGCATSGVTSEMLAKVLGLQHLFYFQGLLQYPPTSIIYASS